MTFRHCIAPDDAALSNGETTALDQPASALSRASALGIAVTLDTEQLELIGAIIQAARPAIQQDGGDIELVAITGDVVRVRLTGACAHCALAGQTLGGIRRQIVGKLGVPLRVLPAPLD
ncbi:NifU family protein [uncultured Thiodictyon sp.]|uniref:NifU family protein n=1 Tax=uncultured Thiodictyon sp. TaxID=1846217 RepID=UPI0025F303A2|nr:NifU family protein [uncultured Thiodictyon sp.]